MNIAAGVIAICVLCTGAIQPAIADGRLSPPIANQGTGMNWETMSWTIAEGHTETYPYLLRIRQVPSEFARQRYPQRLNIFWSVTEADEKGYPTGREMQRLHAFEDRLIAAVESDQFAMLALILTGRREREFVFYTADPDEFLRRLTNMPQEQKPYPITIHLHEDAQWSYYSGQLSSLPGS